MALRQTFAVDRLKAKPMQLSRRAGGSILLRDNRYFHGINDQSYCLLRKSNHRATAAHDVRALLENVALPP
ncbi:hypothetical protein [Caballeronia grimmiae]|uniref:hypothetical protein n=1 Tax=Caballeronia grimmiae TaxID=1071679 RepID=UPI0038B83CFE